MSIFGGGSANKPTPPSATLRVQTAIAGKPVPIVWGQVRIAGNLIWYSDFSSRPAPSSGGKAGGKGGGGGGKGGKGGSGSYDYSANVAIGLCEGPVAAVETAYNGSTGVTLASLNFSTFLGSYTQAAWSWAGSTLTGFLALLLGIPVEDPGVQPLPYRGLCYVGAAPFDLGGSPALPNINFEIAGIISGAISGFPDADPSLVIADFLTNPNYGVGFPAAMLGDFSLYQAMALAAGLVVSDGLVSQTSANTYLADLLTATNSEFVWSDGLLKIVPYGDVGSISGNGYAYDPPSVPLFSLGDDDYMKNSGGATIGVSSYTTDDPVIVVRKRRSDALNDIKVEYLDRSSQYVDPSSGDIVTPAYNPTIAEAMDEASIITWGLRPGSTMTMHFFCIASAAMMAANLQLRRQGVLSQYTFTLDQRYIVLDPMDVIEISDAYLGLVNQAVQITEITENDDSSLTFVANEYLGAVSAIPAHGSQLSAGYVPNYNIAPPATNPPIIFAAPSQIATNGSLEVWMVASGPVGWGGADVWISGDGDTYLNVGRLVGPGRQGVLVGAVPSRGDPDTADHFAVDLTESAGSLLSGTTTDADNANTLCYLDGELIAYSTATLTAQFQYSLVDYTRRGLYGTTNGAHAAGTPFARLDSQVFRYPYSVDQIGKPLFVKLTAFNVYGGGEESLADVTAYETTLPAPPPPSNVMNFSAKETNGLVSFAWDAVSDFALRGYDIGYAPQGTTDWSAFLMLTEAGAGTEMTNADVPGGTWTFGIRARDIAEQLSPIPTLVDLQVTSQTGAIAEVEQAPGWAGTLSGFVLHYTGVLIPEDQNPLSHYTAWSDFSSGFQPTPVTSASYTAPTIDGGYDFANRVHATTGHALMPGQTGAPTIGLSIDTWLTGASDPNTFTAWTIAYLTLRYLRARITYSGITAGAVSYIDEFEPIIDTGTPPVQYIQAATIAPGGSTVTFDNPFHTPPQVIVSVIAATALYGTASSITATDCVINVWDTSGTSVGGDVSMRLEGE